MSRVSLAVAALLWGAAAQAQDFDYGAQAFYRVEFGGAVSSLTQSVGYMAGAGAADLSQRVPSAEYRWSAKGTQMNIAGMPVLFNGKGLNAAEVAGGAETIMGIEANLFWGGAALLAGTTAVVVAANSGGGGGSNPSGSGSGSGGN